MKDPDLVDEISTDGSGWARFDSTRRYRYRLGRAISQRARMCFESIGLTARPTWIENQLLKHVVFVMLNPSTADAFKEDRTVSKCMAFAELWGFDVLEVVNIFAIRTPYPEDVKQLAADERGAGPTNDEQIIAAIQRPNVKRVVAAWGNHGALDLRGEYVTGILQGMRAIMADPFELLALKILPGGVPIHPLARGKQFIPMSIEPVRWP